MHNRRIIGLAGPSRVGKDTIAKLLPGYTRAAFADNLKSDCRPLFTILGLDVSNPTDKETLRPVMVEYGKAARRVDGDFWIKRLAMGLPAFGVDVVITDVRYLNEVRWIRQNGGVCFMIRRDGILPANHEELHSLQAIAEDNGCPIIDNSTPEAAAANILAQAAIHYANCV